MCVDYNFLQFSTPLFPLVTWLHRNVKFSPFVFWKLGLICYESLSSFGECYSSATNALAVTHLICVFRSAIKSILHLLPNLFFALVRVCLGGWVSVYTAHTNEYTTRKHFFPPSEFFLWVEYILSTYHNMSNTHYPMHPTNSRIRPWTPWHQPSVPCMCISSLCSTPWLTSKQRLFIRSLVLHLAYFLKEHIHFKY
jgi:hypothetical protein